MSAQVLFMLTLLAVAVLLFVSELLPIEATAGALLCLLLLTGTISLEGALAGLSNKAVPTIACMFVLSHALTRTGLLEIVVDRMSGRFAEKPWLAIAIFLTGASLLSGVLNNTAVVAIFIPLASHLCHNFRISASKVLLPLSYVSIIGGTLTLIGTSTNLLVSAMAEMAGMRPFGMFEFSRLGIVICLLGLAYTLIFARRFLPSRAGIRSLTRKYHMAPYLTEVQVSTDSGLVGSSCREVGLNQRYDITVLAVVRGKERHTEEVRDMPLEQGDILIVRGTLKDLIQLRREQGVALLTDMKLDESELSGGGRQVVEALVALNSSIIGKNLKELDFYRHFGAFVLAIRRHRETIREKIAHVRLEFADSLLMLAPRDRIDELRRSEDLIVVSEGNWELHKGRFWWLSIAIIPVVVGLAAFGLMDITEGAILAVVLLLVAGVITPQEAYRAVDWSVLILIASFVPVGQAMIQTGTAGFIASGVMSLVHYFPASWAPQAALSLTYALTSLLTQMVSNNASAIMLVPISLSLAGSLGVDPRPFLVAVCFAASAEFMTPVGYQTNLMVYGPGNYRFLDYTRFGAPLNVGFWIAGTLLIPYFWPL
jgi:di/tricarboxylate transporter